MSDASRHRPQGSHGRMGMMPFGSGDDRQAEQVGQTLKRLFGYLRGQRLAFIVVVVTAAASAGAQALAPLYIARAVDGLKEFVDGRLPSSDAGRVLVVAMVLVLAFYIAGWLAGAVSRVALLALGQRVLLRMRSQIMGKVHALSLGYFDHHKAGDLVSRLSNDTDVINRAFGMSLSRLAQSVLLLVAILIGMLALNWRLALVSFALLPLMYLSTAVFSRHARVAFRKTRRTISGVSSELEQNISGARVAQAFNRQGWNSSSFRALNRANRDANVGAESLTAAFAPTMDVLSAVGLAVVLAYGGYLARADLVSIGVIVGFVQYVRRFFEPVQSISMMWTQVQSAIAGAERIFELLDEEPRVRDADGARPLDVTAGRVELSKAAFAYEPETPVLHGVDLVAEPGQTVALVGPTGAGKTTIISLLERFYDVQAGAVTIDGQDVRAVTQDSLRQSIGIVLQDTFLFADTIAPQHPLRPAGRRRRGGGGCRAPRAGARVHLPPPRRLRHRAAGRRGQPEPRPAPVAGHRPRAAQGPAHPGAGRGNLQRRHPHRAADPGGAGRAAAGPHQLRHRPPPEHGAARRRDLRDRRRPHRRARHPRRADRSERHLRAHLPEPVRARGRRRRGCRLRLSARRRRLCYHRRSAGPQVSGGTPACSPELHPPPP